MTMTTTPNPMRASKVAYLRSLSDSAAPDQVIDEIEDVLSKVPPTLSISLAVAMDEVRRIVREYRQWQHSRGRDELRPAFEEEERDRDADSIV